MLSIAKIFELLDKLDPANGSAAETARLDAANLLYRGKSRPAESTGAQIELLTALTNYRMNIMVVEPWHPTKTQTLAPTTRPRGRLSKDEQRFLTGLPSTPRNMGHATICRVLGLVLAMREDPLATHELAFVESIWAPIERYCDLKHAQDDVAQAQISDLVAWPRSLAQAVADVLLADGTATDPEDALRQADDRIDQYMKDRAERRAFRAAQARRNLDELSELIA